MSTTHIINWKDAASKTPLTVITDPDSIYTGDKIKVSLYSAYQHDLLSPYGGLGSKSIATLPTQDEIIDLSGTGEVSAKYPIKTVLNLQSAIPIVDESTRLVVIGANQPIPSSLIKVVNQRLQIANGIKLHGSIRLVYQTFPGQVWTHAPFTRKGNPILFAHNLDSSAWENVPLSISDKNNNQNDSIRIEFYPTDKFDLTPYAHFIVFPADANVIMKTDVGLTRSLRSETRTIKSESVSFSGNKETSASFYINSMESFKGVFFDGDGNECSPSFSVSNGRLVSTIECWGMGYLNYKTSGLVYAYDAEVTTTNIPGGGQHIDVQIGTVYAFLKNKKGIAASYNIPLVTIESSEPTDFIEIYKEIVIDRNGAWEKPDNFSGDENTMIQQYVVATGYYYTNGITDVATYGEEQLGVYKGQPFSGVKYMMNKNIPTDANAYVQMAIATKVADLTFKYGIPNV